MIACTCTPLSEPRRAHQLMSACEIRHRTCMVTLAGEFDRATVDALAGEIKPCLDRASSVLFDLGAVTFIDGAVLALLLDILEEQGEGGWLGVARPRPWIERLLEIAGLTDKTTFRIFSTRTEALEAIDRG